MKIVAHKWWGGVGAIALLMSFWQKKGKKQCFGGKDSTHKERRGRVAMIEFVAIYLC